ncbi:MAG: D-glycero-beta-D-manno-heptose 1-phosphate adenylyltransferase [Candidatus Omnitrophica bacterium]|nr:D-glycero-beta-D-manno-heptose 1-phosphate adenylyltransferase [Candidatus Omnitrophota bacterium]
MSLHPMIRNKIKTLPQLKKIVFSLKSKGKKVVFTNGCFDILHAGHVQYLEDARKMGNALVVAVNSDSSVKAIKGKTRPLVAEKDRIRVIAALESVDFVVLFKEYTPLRIIQTLIPDILVKGSDWDKNKIAGGDFVTAHGGSVRTIRLLPGRSTSGLIKKILHAGRG